LRTPSACLRTSGHGTPRTGLTVGHLVIYDYSCRCLIEECFPDSYFLFPLCACFLLWVAGSSLGPAYRNCPECVAVWMAASEVCTSSMP
jgi:hypothetical protein